MKVFSGKEQSPLLQLEQRISQFEQRISKQFGANAEMLELLAEKVAALQEMQQGVTPLVKAVGGELARDLGDKVEAAGRQTQELHQAVGLLSQSIAARLSDELGRRLEAAGRRTDELQDAIGAAVEAAVTRLSQELGGKIESGSKLTGDLRDSVQQGFEHIVQRLDTDLSDLAQSTQNLDSTVRSDVLAVTPRLDQISALAQRLDSDVVAGFAAIAQRLEGDLVQLGQTVHRMDASLAAGLGSVGPQAAEAMRQEAQAFAKALQETSAQGWRQIAELGEKFDQVSALAQRLDSDVASGFTAVAQRLEDDLVGLAQTVHRMDASLAAGLGELGPQMASVVQNAQTEATAQLSQKIQETVALANSLQASVRQEFEQIVGRLETELVTLANRTRELETSLSGEFQALAPRLGDTVREISVAATQNLAQQIGALAALIQRLDGDVGQGFTAVAQRLEGDLVQLADAVHRMDGSIASGLGVIGPQVANARDGIGSAGSSELTRKVEETIALGNSIHASVLQGFGQIVQRLESDLVALANRTHSLEVNVTTSLQTLAPSLSETIHQMSNGSAQEVSSRLETLTAATQRLDAEVGQGFSAIAQRLEGDLVQLAQSVNRMEGSIASGLGEIGPQVANAMRSVRGGLSRQLIQKLDAASALAGDLQASMAQGFEQIVQRLDNDLVTIANRTQTLGAILASEFQGLLPRVSEIVRELSLAASQQLSEQIGHLTALAQRLDSDVGHGFAAVTQRLENDLVTLSKATHQLQLTVSESTAALGPSLTESVTQASLHQAQEVIGRVDNMAALAQRLDSDVVKGFASVVQRLETDLVALAGMGHKLSKAMEDHSHLIAKLIVDQTEVIDRVRATNLSRPTDRHRGSGGADFEGAEKTNPPAWISLRDAGLPPTLIRKLKLPASADKKSVWLLDPKAIPRTDIELPHLLEIMADARATVSPEDILVWMQPVTEKAQLEPEEMRQILGLLGPVDRVLDIRDGTTTWRTAIGEVRQEAVGIVLRWSLPALESLHLRIGHVIREALRRLNLTSVLHAIDLPEPDSDYGYWAELISSVAELIAGQDEAIAGFVYPLNFAAASETVDRAAKHVIEELKRAGARPPRFQWVRGSVPIASSDAILGLARKYGIRFDFTVVNRGSADSRLEAYDGCLPYRPLEFDLRLPSFAPAKDVPIALARWSGRAIGSDYSVAPSSARSLPQLFDDDFDRNSARLMPVLDRTGQNEFKLQVNLDATLFGHWAHYFIYNWRPPPPGLARLIEFDAVDLTNANSPLLRLHRQGRLGMDDKRMLTAGAFLKHIDSLSSASFRLPAAPKQLQVEEHSYQEDRDDITADAERLITWMPETLGTTLELGSGLGVMARRIGTRARLYVGIELTVAQGLSLRQAGLEAVAADLHLLPFGNDAFDTIIADNVLEHASDPLQALRECHRVLRPGQFAFLVIPYDYYGPLYRNMAHFWKADAASVGQAIEQAGFRVARQELVRMQEFGVRGAYPSCDGYTGLWKVQKPDAQLSTGGRNDSRFDLQQSRRYWRFAPSGAGKHDTVELLKLPDDALESEWNRAFAARFRQYAEEEQFLRIMSAEFSGKRVLSIGSGLGLHELYYHLHGASITCCDVVRTNLDVIERVAKIKSDKPIATILSQGATQPLGGPYDVVFIYGSLMTMPEAAQRELLAGAAAALTDQGSIVLMLYTWEFARATCGWTSPQNFDPLAFARASDPSVGTEHCPWSDWHDDEKLMGLAGSDWTIARRQLWNQGWFVWYELTRRPTGEPASPFFEFAQILDMRAAQEVKLDHFGEVDAAVERTKARLAVTTGVSLASYALSTGVITRTIKAAKFNAILVDVDVQDGGCSVGLLDEETNSFTASQAIWQLGRAQHLMTIPPLPDRYRLIISNHRAEPEASRFTVHRVAFLHREPVDVQTR